MPLLLVTLERQRAEADRILSLYDKFIKRVRPQIIPYPSVAENQAVQRWIRHVHDVPVLASAVKAAPEWLLTRNRLHFTQRVSDLSGLRIASPLEFFQFAHSFV